MVPATCLYSTPISIHAPHARGDRHGMALRQLRAISIHAPHARGDKTMSMADELSFAFQSTPLMRGATRQGYAYMEAHPISIHAPHARGDQHEPEHVDEPPPFQSTPLMRGATPSEVSHSICAYDFNPRPSCEGRRTSSATSPDSANFNPRPSCEGRHGNGYGDVLPNGYFNPRPSCEGRLGLGNNMATTESFQSTPLMRGATTYALSSSTVAGSFQSTPLMRGAT